MSPMPDAPRVADDVMGDPSAGVLKQRSVRGAAATFVAQGLRFVLQFGSQVALARLLMPAQFGLVAMLGPVVGFVSIFNELGLSQATIQRTNITHQELSNLFWINVAVSGALAVAMALCAPLIAWFYEEPRLTGITVWLATLLLAGGLSAQPLALMNRHMRFVPLATIDVACTLMAVLVGIAAAWSGFGYWSLVLMQAANALTILAMAWVWSHWWPGLPRRDPGTRALLHFGSHVTGYNLISFAGNNLDSVLIGRISGSVALGLYDRGYKLVAAPMWSISLPIARVADALLARLQGAADRYRRAFLLLLQAMLLVTVPAVAFVVTAAGTLVPFLLGRQWAAAAPIVAWLAVATAFAPLSNSASWLFVSQHRAAEQTRFACLRTGIMLAALLAGLPWGAAGVARSYGLFALLVHGVPMWGGTRRGPVTLRHVIGACWPAVVGGAVAALAVHLLDLQPRFIALPVAGRLACEAVLSYAAYCLSLMCLPNGLPLLRDIWLLRTTLRRSPPPVTAEPEAGSN